MWVWFKDHWWEVALGVNYLLAIIAAITVFLSNYNPTKTLSYLMALLAFPFVGLLVYYFSGRNYRKARLFKRKNIMNQRNIKVWQENTRVRQYRIDQHREKEFVDKLKLVRLLQRIEQSPLTAGNKVDFIVNGESKFELLFSDIHQAKNHIHLEYYIFRDDSIGKELIDLLCQKSEEGIKVRINFDYVASSLSNETRRKMQKSGVFFYPFMPVYFPRFASKLNYRNHRKIIVIDGKIGYVGGINVGDEYVNRPSQRYWRDSHLRIEGPAAGMLQLHFALNWDFVTPEDFSVEDDWFPEAQVAGEVPVQIAASGPDSEWPTILELLFMGVNSADRYVYFTTPYFIPNDELVMAITTAAKSGVVVKLLIPGISDSWYAKHASYSYVRAMLEAGVEVYLYQKGILHSKTMVADDFFSTVGTANLDYRSFNLNFEINAMIFDPGFAEILRQQFEEDLRYAHCLRLEDWKKRGIKRRIQESFCRLWAPLL